MKKIFICLIFLLTLTACISTRYSYYPINNYRSDKISISAGLVNAEDESSPVAYIWVSDKRGYVGNSHDAKILSPAIKIVDKRNKEYIIKNDFYNEHIYIYKQGVVITDDFKAYIGKVQLDDGTIIDIPPLSFKKHVYEESYNPVTDTINAGARTKRLFNGTVEEYREWKKKNINK